MTVRVMAYELRSETSNDLLTELEVMTGGLCRGGCDGCGSRRFRAASGAHDGADGDC